MIFDGQLEFSFTSLVTNGCHRIGYRIQGSGDPYTIAPVNCTPYTPPNPAPNCVANITVQLNDQLCGDVVYEGYVQPCCETVDSLNGRVPFEVTFTPDDPCPMYEITCESVGVDSAAMTDNGTKYLVVPNVLISGGGGSGATAIAVLGTGILLAGTENVQLAGAGYTDGVWLNVPVIGGAGTGGTIDVTVVGGAVVSFTINNPGTGYASGNDNFAPDPAAMGPSAPTIVANLEADTDAETITAVTITAPGSGYTSTPTITIDPSAGIQAEAVAILEADCPSSAFGTKCDGTPSPVVGPIPFGDIFVICRNTDPFAMPAAYDVAVIDCCETTDCVDTTVTTNGIFTGFIYYTDCNGDVQTANPGASAVDFSIGCIKRGTVRVSPPPQTGNVVVNHGVIC